MNHRTLCLLPLLLLFPFFFCSAELTEQEIVKRILDRIQENDKIANDYGYFQEALVRDLDSKNKIVKEEKRLYRITWMENEQFNELIKVDGKELTPDQKSDEQKRKSKFLKSIKEKKPEYKLEWKDIFSKYDYKISPGAEGAAYVMTFQPKKGELPVRTRGEKVLNHITGKVWLDSGFNILRGTANLDQGVKFGLGILGNIEDLHIEYAQQQFQNKVWLPLHLRIAFTARILVKSRREDFQSKFFDLYERP